MGSESALASALESESESESWLLGSALALGSVLELESALGSESWLLVSLALESGLGLALESGSTSWLLELASQSVLKSLPERATIDLWTSSAELMSGSESESGSCLKLPWTDLGLLQSGFGLMLTQVSLPR